jgi:hypothetical protein
MIKTRTPGKPRNGKRRPTARRRGAPQLPPNRGIPRTLMRLCVLLRSAKLATIGRGILYLPAIVSTHTHARRVFASSSSTGPPGDRGALTAAGVPSQRSHADSFRFKRAAFYQSLKGKVGLAAAKAAALRINLNVEGCGIVAAPVHAPSRTPLLLPLLLTISLSPAFTRRTNKRHHHHE